MKKRFLSLIMIFALLFTMAPVDVSAKEESTLTFTIDPFGVGQQSEKARSVMRALNMAEYDYAQGYRGQLTEDQKIIYDVIVDFYIENSLSVTSINDIVLYNEEGPVYVAYSLNDVYADMFYAYLAFVYDYPQAFWAGEAQIQLSYNEEDGLIYVNEIYLLIKEKYEGSKAKIFEYNANVKKVAEEIHHTAAETGLVYDYYQAIHDWVCNQATYNYMAMIIPQNYLQAYSSGSVFAGDANVTYQGYSEAFKVLCDVINASYGQELYCAQIIGNSHKGEPHMWNYVYMPDGNWYGIDTSWDDQETLTHTYFLSGANTPGSDLTFVQEHVENNSFASEYSVSFAYPILAEQTYEDPVPTEELKFSGASLTLQDNLAINFKASSMLFGQRAYTDPYVIFSLNGKEVKVDEYMVVDDSYIFSFENIAPNQMNDKVTATLYAKYRGGEYASEPRDYSVSDYAYNMLSKSTDDSLAKFRTLLVDLLEYGAVSQIYTEYKTDNLVNASLTEEQKAWGTKETREYKDVLDAAYETIDNPTATWKGAGLNLKDRVEIRLSVAVEDIEGLTVKVKSESGGEWTIPSTEFEVADIGRYNVYFNGLNAGQMSENVYFTVYNGDGAVSNTVCYSVESYVYKYQNSEDTNLAELVKAMMRYGDSAYNYVNE